METMKNKILVGSIWVVIAYVVGVWAYSVFNPIRMVMEVNQYSKLLSSVVLDSTSNIYLFDDVSDKDYQSRFMPTVGDTLLQIRDAAPSDSTVNRVFEGIFTRGDTLSIVVGSSYGHQVVQIEYPQRSFSIAGFIVLFQAMFPLPFFFVAIWAMIKQGQNSGVRVLTLLLLSISVIFIISIESGAEGVRAGLVGNTEITVQNYFTKWYNVPIMLLASLNTGLFFHLAFLFPSPSRFMRKYPWIVYLLAYPLNIVLSLMVMDNPAESLLEGFGMVQILSSLFSLVQILFGCGMFIVRMIRTDSPLEKRQIRVLLQSVGLGLLLMLISATSMIFFVIGDEINAVGVLVCFVGLVIGLMMIPLGFAYSFSKYRLLEVEGRLKRGFTLLLTSGGLLLIAFIVFFIVSNLVLKRLHWESRASIVFFTLLVALAYVPLHGFFQKRIEKRIFRTRWKLREMLENFLEMTSSLANRASLWEEFGKRLRDNIGVRNMHVFLLDPSMRQFKRLDGEVARLPGDGAIQQEMQKRVRALMVEEIEGSNEIVVSSQEQEWLNDLGVTVLVPIQIHKELVGMMALEFEYGYDEIKAEELDILVSITTRIALENENLRLLEENIEKQRLEEQLATARQVQQQFLPETLPGTPGLEISAHCSFCLEVAGDTFDVIPLENGNTLIAVGDVSGKGAGAAMIMANVQASLRALANTDLPLSSIIEKINTLIAQSTSPEQFITYFAAIYDTEKKTLTCVNAGHNPPRVIRANGDIEEVTEGGLILGMMPNMPYDEVTIPFNKGDVIVAFTDGISEATDGTEEMYGEERIAELVRDNREDHPEQIFTRLIEDLDNYRAGTPIDDDVTIFIAKGM